MSNSIFRAAVFSISFLFLISGLSFGYPGGISGYTKKGSSPGCTCHTSSPSSNVTLTISGPATLNAGETGNYQVMMTYTSTISKGGMDIAASNGTLVNSDSRLKVLNSELTHPSAQNAGATSLAWNFKYTAPSTAGSQTLYATGCAVKSQWNHATNFSVNVVQGTSTVAVTSPAGGETWIAGSTQNITWTNTNVTNVKIEYSSDNGTVWNTIIASTPASAGSYSWVVPNVSSSQCKVKISDAANAATTNTSLAFTISSGLTITPITQIRLNDVNGVSLDTGMVLTVKGIVSVANEFNSPSYVQDSIAGVAVYGRGAGLFSSSVKIGYLVQFTGKIVNYNGLTEFNPVTTFTVLDSGKTLTPKLVTIPQINGQTWNGNEAYEGMLIKIAGVKLASAATTWAGNTNYNIFNGTDTTQLRITTGTTLVGQSAPAGNFDVIGVLSQYKTTVPYNSGYQLLPRFIADITSITDINEIKSIPEGFVLEQNYPNPFNPTTRISYNLKESGMVTLRVFNSLGQEIAILVNRTEEAGLHTVNFNGTGLNSGIYFYSLQSGNNPAQTRKMTILK